MLPELKKEKKNINHHPVFKVFEKKLVLEYFLKGKRKFSDLDQNKID